MLDTHSHLYLGEFDKDIENVVLRAKTAAVNSIFLPAIDSETHVAMLRLEESYPGTCYAMMGLHPCSVKENWQAEMEIVRAYFSKRKFAAVGECGLDFYWDKTFVKEQYEALEAQIQISLAYNIPLVLHTRNSMQEVIELLKKYKSKPIHGVFHCFSGSLEQAKEIIKLGFYMGIGGVVTYKNSGLNEVLKNVPLSSIVLETDAPYLTPVPYRGKRNESSYIPIIAAKIAEIKNVSIEMVAEQTTKNGKSLFQTAFV